jgi:hypothetical protein
MNIEKRLVQQETIKSRYDLELQKKIEENRAFNEAMKASSPAFDHLEICDGMVLVGLLKFEGDQTNDGKLLEVKFKPFQSEGGKPISKVDEWYFSTRAVIIKLPPVEHAIGEDSKAKLQRFKVGDIVWLTTAMLMDPNKRFIEDRSKPVADFGGYLSVPIAAFQMVEKK